MKYRATLLALSLAALSAPVAAEDGAKVSFTFDVGPVKVAIRGVSQDDLHKGRTKEMLKRAAQLAHYSVLQLKQQKDFPECLKRGTPKAGEPFWSAPCLRWED